MSATGLTDSDVALKARRQFEIALRSTTSVGDMPCVSIPFHVCTEELTNEVAEPEAYHAVTQVYHSQPQGRKRRKRD